MDRRSFAAMLPALLAAPGLMEQLNAQTPHHTLPALQSSVYPAFTPPEKIEGHVGKGFFAGMIPGSDGNNIRIESHISYLAPHSAHEAEGTHKHSELWLVREGTIGLNLNGVAHRLEAGQVGICVAGDKHYVENVGEVTASYFVVTVGPPE